MPFPAVLLRSYNPFPVLLDLMVYMEKMEDIHIVHMAAQICHDYYKCWWVSSYEKCYKQILNRNMKNKQNEISESYNMPYEILKTFKGQWHVCCWLVSPLQPDFLANRLLLAENVVSFSKEKIEVWYHQYLDSETKVY